MIGPVVVLTQGPGLANLSDPRPGKQHACASRDHAGPGAGQVAVTTQIEWLPPLLSS